MPNASVASRWSPVSTAWEKYFGTDRSSVSIWLWLRLAPAPDWPPLPVLVPVENRSGRESAGHSVACAHGWVGAESST